MTLIERAEERHNNPVDVVERMALSGPAIGASFRF